MSAIERIRAKYEERQRERHLDVEIWGGDLIVRVGMVEFAGAKGAARAISSLQSEDGVATADLDPSDMADVIAEATIGLYVPGEDGPEQLVAENGVPILFDAAFGEAIGVPEVTDARSAVYAAFTEGVPPKVNALSMLMVMTKIASWLMDPNESAEAIAKGR